MAGVRRRARAPLAVLAALALGTPACFGATPRADFEAELRARGGGLVDTLAIEAVELVRAELGRVFDVRRLSVQPLDARVVLEVIVARDGQTDRWVVRGGEVVSVDPVQLGARQQALAGIAPTDLPLQRLEEMADEAMVALGFDEAWIDSVTAAPDGSGGVRVHLRVESARAYGTVTFDGSGNLLEAVRQ